MPRQSVLYHFVSRKLATTLRKVANFRRISADSFGELRIEARLERIEIRKLSKFHGNRVRFLPKMSRSFVSKMSRTKSAHNCTERDN